jgi:hypothetical protein
MTISHDFSDYPEALYRFAIYQMTWQEILAFDSATRQIFEAPNAKALRQSLLKEDQYGIWLWWLRFSAGVENLVKAVLIRHQVPLITKRNITEKAPGGSQTLTTREAAEVYRIVSSMLVVANANPWLDAEFQRLGIHHPLEINTGTLRTCREKLAYLTNAGKLTDAERQRLSDSLTVLADIRRNVDAHVFLKLQVGGSLQHDLAQVYLPAINLLIDIYHR